MILSQEYKKKHYFFLSRKLVVCFLISITLNNTYAQVQRGKKDDAKAELISFKDRWGIKTNAVDWLLTIPNIGVEFDLGNTIRNKRTIGANIKWNWNTSQKYTPSLIFNVFPKHFVAHGTPSGGLNCAGVSGGERELRSLYLYPFRKAIRETSPWAVMTCYSAYDGVSVTGSSYYMTDILRGELGFKGYTYSDWGSVERLMTFHHAAGCREEAARMALMAGVDLNIDSTYETLEKQVEEGRLDVAYIDQAVRRILTVKFELGLFDETYGDPKLVKKGVRNAEKVALAKKVADESAVLLENRNDILPLDLNKYKSVAVVGPNSNQAVLGDYAWTMGDTKEAVSLL